MAEPNLPPPARVRTPGPHYSEAYRSARVRHHSRTIDEKIELAKRAHDFVADPEFTDYAFGELDALTDMLMDAGFMLAARVIQAPRQGDKA